MKSLNLEIGRMGRLKTPQKEELRFYALWRNFYQRALDRGQEDRLYFYQKERAALARFLEKYQCQRCGLEGRSPC